MFYGQVSEVVAVGSGLGNPSSHLLPLPAIYRDVYGVQHMYVHIPGGMKYANVGNMDIKWSGRILRVFLSIRIHIILSILPQNVSHYNLSLSSKPMARKIFAEQNTTS